MADDWNDLGIDDDDDEDLSYLGVDDEGNPFNPGEVVELVKFDMTDIPKAEAEAEVEEDEFICVCGESFDKRRTFNKHRRKCEKAREELTKVKKSKKKSLEKILGVELDTYIQKPEDEEVVEPEKVEPEPEVDVGELADSPPVPDVPEPESTFYAPMFPGADVELEPERFPGAPEGRRTVEVVDMPTAEPEIDESEIARILAQMVAEREKRSDTYESKDVMVIDDNNMSVNTELAMTVYRNISSVMSDISFDERRRILTMLTGIVPTDEQVYGWESHVEKSES